MQAVSPNAEWIIVLGYLIFIKCGTSVGLINVAVNKPAHQSTNTGAERAVDGNVDQNVASGSCLETNNEYEPFWEVDLEEIYVIERVTLYRNHGCCYESEFINVLVSNDQSSYTHFSRVWTGQGITLNAVSTNPIQGRWVKVIIPDKFSTLRLCEVQVMSLGNYHKDWFERKQSSRGTGSILESNTVLSVIQCAVLCRLNPACYSFNVRTNMVASPEMDCQLLDSFSYSSNVLSSNFYTTASF